MGGKNGNNHGSRKHVPSKAKPVESDEPVSDPRKVSVYLPTAIMDELRTEAQRQERSLSWLIQKSWRLARDEIKKLVG